MEQISRSGRNIRSLLDTLFQLDYSGLFFAITSSKGLRIVFVQPAKFVDIGNVNCLLPSCEEIVSSPVIWKNELHFPSENLNNTFFVLNIDTY